MFRRSILMFFTLTTMVTSGHGQVVTLDSATVAELRRIHSTTELNGEQNDSDSQILSLTRALARAGLSDRLAREYSRHFVRFGRKTDTDPYLLAAIALHESDFNPRAYNRAGGGSHGLMQVVSGRWLRQWADECGAGATRSNLREPRYSICYGAYIFAYFRDHPRSRGQRSRALRAYNSGFRYLQNGYDRRVLNAYRRLRG